MFGFPISKLLSEGEEMLLVVSRRQNCILPYVQSCYYPIIKYNFILDLETVYCVLSLSLAVSVFPLILVLNKISRDL